MTFHPDDLPRLAETAVEKSPLARPRTAVFLALLFTLACSSSGTSAPDTSASSGTPPARSVTRDPNIRPESDRIAVDDFQRVCDALARDLTRQGFIRDASEPPVVTIRQLQNKTGQPIDDAIFQETIRVKLMQHASGAVLFRDDVSYQDILKERVRASDEDVMVTLTDSTVDRHTVDRTKDYGFESGSLSGGSGAGGTYRTEERTRVEQRAKVSGGVAKADYFLRGIVFQMSEDPAAGRAGSYFQYQFRVVDARSGIIVWEKMLDSRPGDPYVKEVPVTHAAAPQAPSAPITRTAIPESPATGSTAVASSGSTPEAAAPATSSGRVLNVPALAAAGTATGAAAAGAGAAPVVRGTVPVADAPVGTPLPAGGLDFGSYHALVIGNTDYTTLPKLGAAGNDARAVAKLLEDDYGYEVRLLLDAERREIVSALNDYRNTLGKADNLLIYYAGHGWFDEEAKQGYWLPVEAVDDDPSDWISNATINDMLRANEANHILVVADSCYSGTLTRGVAIRDMSASVFEKLASRRSRTALTSGGLEPVEDDGGSGHSVFAEAFLDALRDNPGVLEGQGLFAAIRRPVMVNADQSPEYGDIRKAGHDGGDFLFVKSP